MKKALQISIAKTLFIIEEDAFERLDGYLASVKAHFTDTEGKEEIIADIESRIAEQLVESKEKVVTLPTVAKILDLMGTVEDFGDAPKAPAPESGVPTKAKKLYRDPDDAVIAGVCSGLGAYLGVDPVWVRLAFVVFTILDGFGILLYIILWFIMPEAKTQAQKLEMAGSPVTLGTLSERFAKRIGERAEEIKQHGEERRGGLRRLFGVIGKIIGTVIRAIASVIGPVLRTVVGLLLIVLSFFVLVGMMVGSGLMISPGSWVMNDIPLQSLLPGGEYRLIFVAIMLVVAIPAFFVLLGGVSLLRKKSVVSSSLGFGMLGVWLIALFLSSFGAAEIVANYREFTSTSPAYQEVTTEIPVNAEFHALKITDGTKVVLMQGSTTTLTVTGRARDVDVVYANVEDGTLSLGRNPHTPRGICVFCFSGRPKLVLTTPTLDAIAVDHGSRLTLSGSDAPNGGHFSVDALRLEVNFGSYADLPVAVNDLKAQILNGSRLSLRGTANTADIIANFGSTFAGEDLNVGDLQVSAMNGSSVEVRAEKTLTAEAEFGSSVYYSGKPLVTERKSGGSDIRARE